jgi:hypothetical protein
MLSSKKTFKYQQEIRGNRSGSEFFVDGFSYLEVWFNQLPDLEVFEGRFFGLGLFVRPAFNGITQGDRLIRLLF